MKCLGRFAVMGLPIRHSLSPWIHGQFAQSIGRSIIYDRVEVCSDFEKQVQLFFAQDGLGLNITAPLKTHAFQLSKAPSVRCQSARAANTLWKKEGVLHADNTDGAGLCRVLGNNLSGARILILGAGGAVSGIIPALQDAKAKLTLTNRTLEKAMLLAEHFENLDVLPLDMLEPPFDILVNATSGGRFFELLPEVCLMGKPYCYDLNYHASGDTSFTLWAKDRGYRASDGFSMLVEQARIAFFVWHGIWPEVQLTQAMLPCN